jgi:hypothetical protein
MLAFAQPAEAKIVYTPAHRVIGPGHGYNLDLNHDGITDFNLSVINFLTTTFSHSDIPYMRVLPFEKRNQVLGSQKVYAAALRAGVPVGSAGPWVNVKHRYLGLQFIISGGVHYGWARMNVTCDGHGDLDAVLTGYAYETVPKKAIITGKTSSEDNDASVEPRTPPAALEDFHPEPATLGALAMGSPGLSIWRRKEDMDTAQ